MVGQAVVGVLGNEGAHERGCVMVAGRGAGLGFWGIEAAGPLGASLSQVSGACETESEWVMTLLLSAV